MGLQPSISVVIPCFNGAGTLPLQLEALSAQHDPPPFEVIVVDNGSTDGTRSVVRGFAASAPFELSVVSADQWQGASYARNVGIRHARSDRVMFCDSDDVVSQWWIEHGARCFDSCDLWSGAATLLEDADVEQSLDEIRRRFGDDGEWVPPEQREAESFPVIMGCDFGATKTILREVGGFDQSLPSAGEDNDLGFRAARAGVPIFSAPSVRIGYRGKWDVRSRKHVGHSSALAHALIASRYGAWGESHFPRWHVEIIRCLVAGLRMLLVPGRRDWVGWQVRWSIALGLGEGAIRYRYLRRVPKTRLGLGWLDFETARQEQQ